MAMSIKCFGHEVPDDSHDYYKVTCFDDTFVTIVTKSPSIVDTWLSRTHDTYPNPPNSLVVGLDVEWRPNVNKNSENPVATLQICVGNHCLIYQLLFSPTVPQSLKNFLRNPNHRFVGVSIGNDVAKLMENWSLEVANRTEIGVLAAEEYGLPELRKAGLKELTRMVLGKNFNKPKEVTMSEWDNKQLTRDQVLYASVDAFLSCKIGKILISKKSN